MLDAAQIRQLCEEVVRSCLREQQPGQAGRSPDVAALQRRLESLEQAIAGQRDVLAGFRDALDETRSVLNDEGRRSDTDCEAIAELLTALCDSPIPNGADAAPPGPSKLISVIMPCWNREDLIGQAIESVRAQTWRNWELVVVDDGSTDGSEAVIGRCGADPRIRCIRQNHGGVSAARNRGLAESRGAIIAYLDSDNVWYPGYLAAVARIFAAEPDTECAYGAMLHEGARAGRRSLRFRPFDRSVLREGNYIDLSAFSHRRELVDRYGGFDPALTRLVDWDLILRYTADGAPRQIPVVAARCRDGDRPRVGSTESDAHNRFLIRRKSESRIERPIRVLYMLDHYPQLSESYVEAEIRYMRRRGVHVEVWSEIEPVSPFPTDVPVHRGELAAAMAAALPDILHVHWLGSAARYLPTLAGAGLPITVRAHGFDYKADLARRLAAIPQVSRVFLFPHQADALEAASDKIRTVRVAFDTRLFAPALRKDPRLVVRTAAGLPTKDLDLVLRLARRLASHKFMLVMSRCNLQEAFVDEISRLKEQMGSPAEIVVDMPREEVARLVGEAGIYLHTCSPRTRYGMPVSICEAMATGAWILDRRGGAAAGYIGPAGALYDGEEDAARLIQATTRWSEEEWRRARLRSVERAFSLHADETALLPILDEWIAIAQGRGGGRPAEGAAPTRSAPQGPRSASS